MKYDIDNLLDTALKYKDVIGDLDLALKYASMAAVLSFSPRADACCIIGEIYLLKNNLEWSEFWFSKAINNLSVGMDEVTPDEDYYTTIPLTKLIYIYDKTGNTEKRNFYVNELLKIRPENEYALKFKKIEENKE